MRAKLIAHFHTNKLHDPVCNTLTTTRHESTIPIYNTVDYFISIIYIEECALYQ